jgi:alpha-beta hydrolase superfamily lysophospholipase
MLRSGSTMTKDKTSRAALWRAGLAAMLATAALLGCGSFEEQQRKWIFQPSKETWRAGASAAEGMEDVWIDFHSGASGTPARLHGLWLAQQNADAPVLLYLHGARWDVRGSAPRMRRMHELGFSVLGIDYRGFGKSTEALPSELMAYEDARAAWEWLAQKHPTASRYIFGHSLGGAIAVQLASEAGADLQGLMLEGTFTSIPAVFDTMKWGWLPLGPFITQRFDSASRIARVKAPVLVVHGSADRLIRPELGQQLFEQVKAEKKKWLLIEGGSHHNTNALGQAQYREALAELFGLGAKAGGAAAAAMR